MFRIKQKAKSAPKLISDQIENNTQKDNKYSCLKQISNLEEHWKNLLLHELDMSKTIAAFQNVQVSMRIDARKKLMLRETFVLKKQIIKLIIYQKFDELLVKLQVLGKKSPIDLGLVTIFEYFLKIREQIILKKYQYAIETIQLIKKLLQQGGEKIEKEKASIIYGRIIYVLALHLIRINGVLITKKDIGVVVQALNLKKKQLCMISCEINQTTLQSILHLTFEFYKILHILKHEQQLITQYYYQIKAYISIFKSKCKNFKQFQNNFKIEQKIQKIMPISLNLKIYDDHERRKILSIQNTQSQLIKNHFSSTNSNLILTQIHTQVKNKQTAQQIQSQSLSSQNQIKNQLDSQIQNTAIVHVQQKDKRIQKNSQKNIQRFCFDFIKPDGTNILTGTFKTFLNANMDKLIIQIKLCSSEQLVGSYRIDETIQNQKQTEPSIGAKRLWKVMKEHFYTDNNEFLPNLFSFQHPNYGGLPKNLDPTYELPIMVRIHQIMLHFLRNHAKIRKMNGVTLQFPKIIQQEPKMKSKQVFGQSKIFAKRYGFISYNSNPKKLYLNKKQQKKSWNTHINNDILKIVFFLKEEEDISICQLTIEKNRVKQFYIRHKTPNRNKSLNNSYNKLTFHEGQFVNERKKSICKIIKYAHEYKAHNSYFMDDGHFQDFNHRKYTDTAIEQQFQVMKSPVLETKANSIKKYRNNIKYFENKKLQNQITKKIFNIGNQLLLFYQEKHNNFIRYYDNKRQFVLRDSNKNFILDYKKFRLFKIIVFRNLENKNNYQKISCRKSRTEEQNKKIFSKVQLIELQWSKTIIFKANRQYYYLNIFISQQKNVFVVNLYDFANFTSYMAIIPSIQFINKKLFFDQTQKTLNGVIKMFKVNFQRQFICDAQIFLNNSQLKNKEINTEIDINNK